MKHFGSLDCRNGNKNTDIDLVFENTKDIFQALKLLDGIEHTLLLIEKNNEQILIGGGPDKFIVSKSERMKSFTLRSNTESSDSKARLCIGGQYGNYPSKYVCDFKCAYSAAQSFFTDTNTTFQTWECS